MKRLLVIAYYFPPMGLSGVQRIAKFVKYLPENGWAPTVLTIDPGGYFAFDQTLLEELDHPDITIVRTASFDPTRVFSQKAIVSLPRESSRKWLSGLSQFLFVPDNKLGWYRPAVKKALDLHQATPFDCILATAPPYTCSLIARSVSKRSKVPYVLDFRDDWLENPRHVYPTPLHRKLHKLLEAKAFSGAASVVTINEVIAEAMKRRHPQKSGVVRILKQGYDPADFESVESKLPDPTFKLLYTGVFYDAQTPEYFLKALAGFIKDIPEVRTHLEASFIGLLPESSRSLINILGLEDVVAIHDYLPHNRIASELSAADVLWMTVGSGPGQASISTSKLYEYMGAQKPILGLVPEGTARTELKSYGASFLAYPEQTDEIKSRLKEMYTAWKGGKLPIPSASAVEPFNRKKLTARLASLLNEIVLD